MNIIKINFDEGREFGLKNVKTLGGLVGLYFIFNSSLEIQYPFKKSRLIYIGMSEKPTNSMGKRLTGHYDGSSGNIGIVNYRKVEPLFFTSINFDMLRSFWPMRIEDLESYFILDFVKHYGVYPICNNKTGFEVLKGDLDLELKIDWNYFELR